MNKKRVWIIVIAVVAIAALIAGGWWWWVTYGSGDDEGVLGGSGVVEAQQVTVAPLIASTVTSVEVDEGADVASGTVMFRLDDEALQLQVDQAAAGVRAAQAALDQARADAAPAGEIAQAQARVDQANAALSMAQLQLGYATISAPVDGAISSLTTVIGESTAPGRTMAILIKPSTLFVSIYLSETEIGQVKVGDSATTTTDSSDREFEAEVVFIATQAEFTPSNVETEEQRTKLVYEVRLSIEDVGGVLKPGMPVDVVF